MTKQATLEEMFSAVQQFRDAVTPLLAAVDTIEHLADEVHHMEVLQARSAGGLNLASFQADVAVWSLANFPKSDFRDKILGLQEEVGALARVVLKSRQGIKGYALDTERTHDEIRRKLADIVIFALSVAEAVGVSLEDAIQRRWAVVSQRDWVHNPQCGLTPVVVSTDSVSELTFEDAELV